MDILETQRLVVRPFVMDDTLAINRILNAAFGWTLAPDESISWVRWSVANYKQLEGLHWPPYGDRAIILKETGDLIGSVGFVPCLAPFGQLPSFQQGGQRTDRMTTEFGLFWAIDPVHQRRGYATEAARAMVDHAFAVLRLRRVVATTEYENVASQSVARKLGMRLERNPLSDPPWFQVVGVLEASL